MKYIITCCLGCQTFPLTVSALDVSADFKLFVYTVFLLIYAKFQHFELENAFFKCSKLILDSI